MVALAASAAGPLETTHLVLGDAELAADLLEPNPAGLQKTPDLAAGHRPTFGEVGEGVQATAAPRRLFHWRHDSVLRIASKQESLASAA